jgi:uncharacterized protein YjbI with pentapeptide repeats
LTGLAGYFKYLDQKSQSQYSENLKNLYSTEKEQVLSSIANLVTFKNKTKLKRISLDILINRIYTELDYNICNAISNQLVTLVGRSSADELNYVIDRLIDMNYNYFLQDAGIKGRVSDLKKCVQNAEKDYDVQKKNPNDEQMVLGLSDDLKERVKLKWKEYNELKDLYEIKLLWHKQIIGDTLGMILSRASKLPFNNIVAKFVANDFNYCTFRNVIIHQCSMERSAFGASIFQRVTLDNIYIDDNALTTARFEDCIFSNGTIRATTFHGSKFYGVKFSNIEFDDVCFFHCDFVNCVFENVKGVSPICLYYSTFVSSSIAASTGVENIKTDEFTSWLNTSKFAYTRMDSIMNYIDWLAQQQQAVQPAYETTGNGTKTPATTSNS